jgi:predicted nucleic acid-binding protein
MTELYLIDTDVIIEYLRGSDKAIKFLEELEGLLNISVISVAELFSGLKGDEEEQKLKQFLLAFEIIDVDEDLAKIGGIHRRDYHSSHGTGLADAIIAASAQKIDATLVTFNQRHYPMVEKILVPYRRH